MAVDHEQYDGQENYHPHIEQMPTNAIDSNIKHHLVANYSPNSKRYSTINQSNLGFSLDLEPTTSHDHAQIHHQSPAGPSVRRRSSFREYIVYAYHQTARADHYYLISSLLCLNVFMSILNTILLSFMVKSLQLGDHKLLFGDGKLAWDTHLEGMILGVPASIVQGHSLSVASIESHGRDKPLVIGGFNDQDDDSSESLIDQSTTARAPGVHGSRSQLLISTGSGQQPASYVEINGISEHRDPRVAIVTDSLLVNQLSKLSTTTNPNEPNSDQKPEGGRRDKSSKQRGKVMAERVLELDTRRQLAVLPLLERVELAPPPASVLHVNDMLRCDSGISGTLGSNLDVQMRVGNLSCQSGRTLALVSRSGKLNLAPLDTLLLDAPTLQMSAPTTRRLTISGIEFVNVEQQQQKPLARPRQRRSTASLQRPSQRDEQSDGDEQQLRQLQKVRRRRPRAAAAGLRAYNLMLVNGELMATSD